MCGQICCLRACQMSFKVNKIALSANDDKRIIHKDKIHTKALR